MSRYKQMACFGLATLAATLLLVVVPVQAQACAGPAPSTART